MFIRYDDYTTSYEYNCTGQKVKEQDVKGSYANRVNDNRAKLARGPVVNNKGKLLEMNKDGMIFLIFILSFALFFVNASFPFHPMYYTRLQCLYIL